MNNLPLDFSSWLANHRESLPGASNLWLENLRAQAREWIRSAEIPDFKQEAWRYTSLKEILAQQFSPVNDQISLNISKNIPDDFWEALLEPEVQSNRIVFINGRYDFEHSRIFYQTLPPGVRLQSLRVLLEQDPTFIQAADYKFNSLFTALNTAGFTDGLVMALDPGVILEQPIEILHLAVGGKNPEVIQPRFIVWLAEGAQATLIERYYSLELEGEASTCTNVVLEIVLQRAAQLRHERVQQESAHAFHRGEVNINLGESSRYNGVVASLGGHWSRTDLGIKICGAQAECDLQGFYLADARQLTDIHLNLEHQTVGGNSRVNFKGMLVGKGRAVFDGKILITPNAQKTTALLTNQNLVLCAGAELDTRPQLEILADDVQCGHGTTVGPLDPEQLFYLRARGLTETTAYRILSLGFASEIFNYLSLPKLREQIAEYIGKRIESADYYKFHP